MHAFAKIQHPIQIQGAAVLTPRDIAVYLERTWQLYVPGFAEDVRLRPYRKIVGNNLNVARRRTARHAAAQEAEEDQTTL